MVEKKIYSLRLSEEVKKKLQNTIQRDIVSKRKFRDVDDFVRYLLYLYERYRSI